MMAPAGRNHDGQKTRRDRILRWSLICSMTVAMISCGGNQPIQEYTTDLRCPDCPALKVDRVIDGDTFVSPLGRVRLFGVDTPERGMPCFNEARQGFHDLAGHEVRVENGPRRTDPGGRLLFYLYTINGNSIEEILLRSGLARAWTRDGQHVEEFSALESKTRRAGEGCLWNTSKDR